MDKQSNYNEHGDAKHYNETRLNSLIKWERVYGTLAVMTFCEITAEKYRERIGKKDNPELDIIKMKWYDKAAKHYYLKLSTIHEIIRDNRQKLDLPWKEKK